MPTLTLHPTALPDGSLPDGTQRTLPLPGYLPNAWLTARLALVCCCND